MPGSSKKEAVDLASVGTAEAGVPVGRRTQQALPRQVKELRLIQRLLRRDMRASGLSLRAAARQGPMPLGTLSHLLDARRITELPLQPKRPQKRATLMQLRVLRWIHPRTARVIDALLAAADRVVDPQQQRDLSRSRTRRR